MRLDHLLSKEHSPPWVAVRAAPIVVVFTSGIIDIPPLVCLDLVRGVVGRLLPAGCCPGAGAGWVGAHCWGSEESGALPLWGSRLGLRYQEPGRCRSRVCVAGGGVGLLFEIWIVDASIFVVCCVHCHV